jgi:hypothetical protein
MKNFLITLLILGILISCDSRKVIAEVNTSSDLSDHNSILYLTESCNVEAIYDTNISNAFPQTIVREYFDSMQKGKVIETKQNILPSIKILRTIAKFDHYSVQEVLIDHSDSKERCYTIHLITRDSMNRCIDQIQFACWRETDKFYFSGKLFNDNSIEISQDNKIIRRRTLLKNGNFL